MTVTDFVYDNYPSIHGKITKEQVANLLTIYDKQVIVIRKEEGVFHKRQVIKGVGFYFRLSNRMLKEVKDRIVDIGNPRNAIYLLRQNGRNIHFAFLVAKGVKTIMKGLKEVIKREQPKTVSWFDPSMEHFFIRKI